MRNLPVLPALLLLAACAGSTPSQENPASTDAPAKAEQGAKAELKAEAAAAAAAPARSTGDGPPVLPDGTQFTTTPSGLQYAIIKAGAGATPQNGQVVEVHYTGWLESNGARFDSSVDRGRPFTFPLGAGKVIKGWDEGVATMQVGEKRRLVIPSDLGYGARGAGGAIPPNATLVFDVELLGIK